MPKTRATIKLPPLGASDIVTRHLNVAFDDRFTVFVNEKQVSPGSIPLPGDEVGFTIDAAFGTRVTLHLVEEDKDGNHSPPSPTLTLAFERSFAPPTPGAMVVDSEEILEDTATSGNRNLSGNPPPAKLGEKVKTGEPLPKAVKSTTAPKVTPVGKPGPAKATLGTKAPTVPPPWPGTTPPNPLDARLTPSHPRPASRPL